ncbi:MAG TPA: hypothetical protein PKY12_10885 [Catalimonadaceae bacterium]|nr:hypothetical protein [Catalimonadaceae bacterium]
MEAEELAQKVYYELKEDSIAIERMIEGRLRREAAFHLLRGYFKDSSLTQISKKFFLEYAYHFPD